MAEEIICLGKRFNSEDERLEYFRNELRKKLPELKKIDGFPIGEDEDIIALSDPPYYTACPNPWINDIIDEWENEKDTLHKNNIRIKGLKVDEPYAYDISEGKNNPIYNVHTYHTKVPHPAIMRYLLHYTQPGDIVFDGFAGTGMTGVASYFCGNANSELKILIEQEWQKVNSSSKPNWGKRKAICNDLSPAASFISYNYNSPLIAERNAKIFQKVLLELNEKYGWLFETYHAKNQKGKINYVVWSEVLLCPSCNSEIIYFTSAVKRGQGIIDNRFRCNNCGSDLTKDKCEKNFQTIFDHELKQTIKTIKYIPIFINYSFAGRRYEKEVDEFDIELLQKIDQVEIPFKIPITKLPEGDKTGEPRRIGLEYVHQLYTKRNLIIISFLWDRLPNDMKWIATSFLSRNLTKCNRFIVNNHNPNGRINGPLTGTLYIPSEIVEQSGIQLFRDKQINFGWETSGNVNQVSSAGDLRNIKDNSVDYIFTDPPFGLNYMYSELNYIWEAWLSVFTENKDEAIENHTQNKGKIEYQFLMSKCFTELYRILKPGRWMTVEFSNTSAAIWNAIQHSIQKSGFIISNVTALDKVHGGIKSMRYTTSVKQDLVISCYKPEKVFTNELYIEKSDVIIWDFIKDHMNHLPIHLVNQGNTVSIIERTPKILYDRLITHYLLKGLPIPIDAKRFQEGLKQRFVERDGMYFTLEQVAVYENKKNTAPHFVQLSWQIATEEEGIEWLKRELNGVKLKYQDIQPKWMQAIISIRKGDILPELRDILHQNFIEELDGSWREPNMNEAKDREIIRSKALLKEFNNYVELADNPKFKRMKEVRVEALHVGFKHCWEIKDFQTIIKISDKIPQNLLLEDERLLMYFDIAKDRV